MIGEYRVFKNVVFTHINQLTYFFFNFRAKYLFKKISIYVYISSTESYTSLKNTASLSRNL
jgi:hypothetical protein